jgi:hypothetical protein
MLSASLSEAIQANKNGKPPSMPSSKSNNDFIATNDDQSFSKASTASASNNIGYMKDLDRVQEQQVVYAGKIEKEKHRQKQLNDSIRAAKQELLDLKALTKNGKIVNEEKAVHGKYLHKLEHQVQQAKIRLSSARGENISMKKKIDQLRRDKMLYNQIQKDFVSIKYCAAFCSMSVLRVLYSLYFRFRIVCCRNWRLPRSRRRTRTASARFRRSTSASTA